MAKIVFMGTPDFAVKSLATLLERGFDIAGVITSPDKPAGRGRQLSESAVKKFAVDKGLYVLQPLNLKEESFLSELRSLKADLQLVVAFRMLPEVVWNMPPLGTYNLHASLLPKYRGAAPINHAIINGDTESGVTTFKLQHEIDTGNIVFQKKTQITPDMTAGELHDVLMNIGADLLADTAAAVIGASGTGENLKFLEQDEKEVSHAPKIFRPDCKIDWLDNAEVIRNKIRGLSPYPAAFSELVNGEAVHEVKIFRAQRTNGDEVLRTGSLITDSKNFLKVKCGAGILEIQEIQIQGKKRMEVKEFLRGFKFSQGAFFR